MKSFAVLGAVLLLAGCAARPASAPQSASRAAPAADSGDTVAREFAGQFLREKLVNNGPALLCGQEAYRACYQIDETQCMAELKDKHESCITNVDKKMGGKLIVGQNDKEYSQQWTMCVMLQHAMQHAGRLQEVGACLKNMKFDEAQGMKALLK